MKAHAVNPILNDSNIQEGFAWFESRLFRIGKGLEEESG